MSGVKGALASKTIWATIIGAVFAILDVIGINLPFTQAEVSDVIYKIVEVVSFGMAAFGRFTATKQIGTSSA
jgi:uncharacterized membrane protein